MDLSMQKQDNQSANMQYVSEPKVQVYNIQLIISDRVHWASQHPDIKLLLRLLPGGLRSL